MKLTRGGCVEFLQMEFSYGTKKWKSKGLYVSPKEEDARASGNTIEFALGLHAPGRFDKIMPIHNCLLQHDVSNQVGIASRGKTMFSSVEHYNGSDQV